MNNKFLNMTHAEIYKYVINKICNCSHCWSKEHISLQHKYDKDELQLFIKCDLCNVYVSDYGNCKYASVEETIEMWNKRMHECHVYVSENGQGCNLITRMVDDKLKIQMHDREITLSDDKLEVLVKEIYRYLKRKK